MRRENETVRGPSTAPTTRLPWIRPVLRIVPAAGAEMPVSKAFNGADLAVHS